MARRLNLPEIRELDSIAEEDWPRTLPFVDHVVATDRKLIAKALREYAKRLIKGGYAENGGYVLGIRALAAEIDPDHDDDRGKPGEKP